MDLAAVGGGRWKLFDAFNFLRLRYAERRLYDWLAVGVAAVITAAYWAADEPPPLMGDGGLLKDVKDFVQVLFPFFVGALAAVATFGRAGLDEPTIGGKVTLRRGSRDVPLTRRQFVCMMFGYCALVCIILFSSVIIAKLVQPFAVLAGADYLPLLRVGLVFYFALAFSHMIIVTLWSLYYLSNRLVR